MNRSSSILVVLIILLTFPLWFGLGMGLFGLVAGLIGGLFGLIAGLFGAIIGIIAGIFKAIFHGIFGWGHSWNYDFPDYEMNGYVFLALLIVAALIITKRNKKAT
jgi:hypothetical protein